MKMKVKPLVFWPTFILMIVAVILSLFNLEQFSTVLSNVTLSAMKVFGSGFELLTTIMLLVSIAVCFMPLGRVKIGGSKAKPEYNLFNYFTMCLAMTVASGLMFWGALEPIYHVTQPPASYHIVPGSPESAIFALSSIFMHWTLTPYAIYGVPTVMFAFAYYNMKKSFTVSSMLSPLMSDEKVNGTTGKIVDSIILFAMVLGVSTTLGEGSFMVSGGVSAITGIETNKVLYFFVCFGIVASFVISAIKGISDGLKNLAKYNFYMFLFFLVWIFIFGSPLFSINLSVEAFGNFLDNFFSKSLFTGAAAQDDWPVWWTIWNYAIWMAWAPVSAVFLGRISYGYNVRTIVGVNVFLSAVFSIIWFTVFGGTSIHMQMFEGINLGEILATKGNEMVTYAFLGELPIPKIIIPVFVATVFITYVAGADGMCATLAGLCTNGISPDNPESGPMLKIVWGILLGGVAWITMSFAGLDGLKSLSDLGAITTLIFLTPVTWALVKVAMNPYKYDTFKEDYDEYGQPKREKVNLLPESKAEDVSK